MPFETFRGRLKVKVTGVKYRSKWPYTYIELVRAITCISMHGFQNNFCTVVVLSLRRRIGKLVWVCPSI